MAYDTKLKPEECYTDIMGLYEAIKHHLRYVDYPEDYIFDPREVYISRDIMEQVFSYLKNELHWDDFSIGMSWANSGPKAIEDLHNYTVIVGDNWCQPKEDEPEDINSIKCKELLKKLFHEQSGLYTALKADIGYHIYATLGNQYYYMEDEWGAGQFYFNSSNFNHGAFGAAYAIPATPKEDCLYSDEEVIDYTFDKIYERFKDYIDKDPGFVDALMDVLIGQSLDEVEEELKDKTIYEYQNYIEERFR